MSNFPCKDCKEFSIELKKIRIPKYIYLKYTDINEEELLEYLEENNIIVIPIKNNRIRFPWEIHKEVYDTVKEIL